MKSLDELLNKIKEIEKGHNDIKELLMSKCWKTVRKESINESYSDFPIIDLETHSIEKKLIPSNFFLKYRKWYSIGKVILENNGDNDSLEEFIDNYKSITSTSRSQYLTPSMQLGILDIMNHQLVLLQSLPDYLDGQMYNLELNIASTIMGDELREAKVLLDKKFFRAAGALSGVILERHIKYRLNKFIPRIKYYEKATLGQLIKKAEENKIFDTSMILKLKYLNSIRIKCDHDKENEPKENEIKDLIEHTDRFIHFID